MNTENHLLVFYGTECPHCEHMFRVLKKFEEETGIVLEKIEVWHNEENTRIMEGYDSEGECGGVPFFYNTKTKAWLCGEVKYDEVVAWAK